MDIVQKFKQRRILKGQLGIGSKVLKSAASRLAKGVAKKSTGIVESKPATMSSTQLYYKIQQGKIGEKELTEMVGAKDAKWVMKNKELLLARKGNTNKFNAILEKASSGAKGKKGSNTAIRAAEQAERAMTPKGRLEAIRNKYMAEIQKSADKTGIDWSDQNSVMASMPDKLKLSPVGFDRETPFLERYYKNVIEKVLGEKGIQKRLLDSKDLRKNSQGQWEGLFTNGEYRKVEPTEYVKMRLANEVEGHKKLGYSYDLAEIEPGTSNYPMHGTMTQNYDYLTRPSTYPGQNGFWTGILDRLGQRSGMIEYYKGKGASVPFFRMPEFESPIMRPNGISSSNSYGGTGQSLLDMLMRKPGKIQRPTHVSDPRGSGLPFNEYNFGPNVPNPKSMWNTLDFQPGAGPLAYNYQNNENDLT